MSLSIVNLLQWAKQQLLTVSDTPLLDVEILLMHTLQVSRSYLFAFPERILTVTEVAAFKKLLVARQQHFPIAYITGHREFWSLDFLVTQDTLIPRPETELLVELILQKLHGNGKIIADLGTGSGAIALAIAQERPTWEIHAVDISIPALAVAKMNAHSLGMNQVIFQQGYWCDALPAIQFDAIISNPPYLAADDPHLQQNNLRYEPKIALIAKEQGLSDLHCIMRGAKQYLTAGGYLLLEHGSGQASSVRKLLVDLNYVEIELHRDLAGLDRVTCARTRYDKIRTI